MQTNRYQADVWNRKYVFEQSFLPSSILIGGKEILHHPISLLARFGDEIGTWKGQKIIPIEQNAEKSVFVVAMEAENLIVNATVTVEQDGLVKTDFSLMSYWSFSEDNIPRLTGLCMDIPVRKEYATMMHFWPNCDYGVCLSGTVLNSGELPVDGVKLPFKPYVWLGREDCGLGICCESDRNFLNADKNAVYQIEEMDDYVNLRITLLDDMPNEWKNRADAWGDNVKILDFSFGIQATPVKEFPENHLTDWRTFHIGADAYPEIYEEVKGCGDSLLEQLAQKGVKWLILHEDWSLIQNYGFAENEEVMKQLAENCHSLGMKLLLYFGYEVSALMPGFTTRYEQILNKNLEGNTVGGWQRKPVQRAYIACYHSDYSDTLIERVEHVMDVLGADGIYTDGTYIPWECANEQHGCGYRDERGELHYTYPIYAVREFVKKLYHAVHERNGIIDTHQSSCCMMATLSYADSYYDGENIQNMLREDISRLKMDTFRAEFMGINMGIPCNFIAMTTEKYTLRMIAGITLLHNVYPRAGNLENIDFMAKIWSIYDSFGIREAQWRPYWEEQEFDTGNENIYLSYYKKEHDYLLILTSYAEQESKVCLETDCTVVEDLLDSDSACAVVEGKAILPVAYAQLKMYRLS